MQHVGSVLGPLTAEIRAVLAARESDAPAPLQPAAPTSPAQSREAAAQLVALLSDSDPRASEFVDANRDALRLLFDAAGWSEFEARVQGYRFANAQAQLEQALETSAGSR
jgi:hypothetical protein